MTLPYFPAGTVPVCARFWVQSHDPSPRSPAGRAAPCGPRRISRATRGGQTNPSSPGSVPQHRCLLLPQQTPSSGNYAQRCWSRPFSEPGVLAGWAVPYLDLPRRLQTDIELEEDTAVIQLAFPMPRVHCSILSLELIWVCTWNIHPNMLMFHSYKECQNQ